MNPKSTVHKHRMTIHNYDFVVDWKLENEEVKIVEVHIIYHDNPNLLKFMSGKIFKIIVEDIENNELNRRWMD